MSFTNKKYYPILKWVQEQRVKVFVPKYPPEIGEVAGEVVEQRRRCISMLSARSAEAVDDELRTRWANMLRTTPACLLPYMDNADKYAVFERDTYYEAVGVVAGVAKSGLKWTYKPLLTPKTPDEKAALERVTETIAEAIEKELKHAWAAEVRKVPASMRSNMPDEPPEQFLEDVYFGIVRKATQAMPSGSSTEDAPLQSQSVCDDVTQQFHQRPSMQNITQAEIVPEEAFYLGAMEVLNMQLPVDRVFKREGYLASTSLNTRKVLTRNPRASPKKRNANERSETTVCDVIVIDKTGPVVVSCWGCIVQSLEAVIDAHLRRVGSNSSEKPLVLFENLRAQALVSSMYNGEILTSLNHLQTMRDAQNNKLSTVSILTTPTSACMTTATMNMPQSSVVVKQSSDLDDRPAPFRVSVVGVIVDVSALGEVSAKGNPKRNLRIVDKYGQWLSCVLIGEEALNTDLVDGVEAIFFFAHARGGTSTSEGALFMFNGPCCRVIGRNRVAPKLQRQIQIQ